MEKRLLNAAIDQIYKARDQKSLADLQKLIRHLA